MVADRERRPSHTVSCYRKFHPQHSALTASNGHLPQGSVCHKNHERYPRTLVSTCARSNRMCLPRTTRPRALASGPPEAKGYALPYHLAHLRVSLPGFTTHTLGNVWDAVYSMIRDFRPCSSRDADVSRRLCSKPDAHRRSARWDLQLLAARCLYTSANPFADTLDVGPEAEPRLAAPCIKR